MKQLSQKVVVAVKMAKLLLSSLMLGLVLLTVSEAGKVLLYPYGHCFNSHLLNMETLGRIFGDSGHDVHMLVNSKYFEYAHVVNDSSPYDYDDLRFNERKIKSKDNFELHIFDTPRNFTPICEYDTIDFMLYTPLQERFNSFIDTSMRFCEKILENKEALEELRRENFDVFIIEAIDPCSKILADYFDIPFIPLMTLGLGHWDGNPRPPSYIPAPISSFTPEMTFAQRFGNFIMKFMYEFIPILMGFDAPFEDLKAKFNMNTSLRIAQTFNRASIKLVNSDFALDFTAPVEPDTILVGGFSIAPPKPLDGELSDWVMNSGEFGTIVSSFGTLVKNFEGKWKRIFLDAFARVPQNIIWRNRDAARITTTNKVQVYAEERIPDNVKMMQWFPQTSLLANSNVKVLITHCGLNSAFEAAFFGVPVVAIPISADQFNQAAKLVGYGKMGVQLDINTLSADSLSKAIQTVVNDPSYRQNAHIMSQRLRDQLVSKRDTIAFWVDYVIRNKGAHHLKSSAHKLSWWQYHSLDVIIFLIFLISIVSYSVYRTLKATVLNIYAIINVKSKLA